MWLLLQCGKGVIYLVSREGGHLPVAAGRASFSFSSLGFAKAFMSITLPECTKGGGSDDIRGKGNMGKGC